MNKFLTKCINWWLPPGNLVHCCDSHYAHPALTVPKTKTISFDVPHKQIENTNAQITQNLLHESKHSPKIQRSSPRISSELAQQQSHEIPQPSLALSPHSGTTGSDQMGSTTSQEIHQSMVHTTRTTSQQS